MSLSTGVWVVAAGWVRLGTRLWESWLSLWSPVDNCRVEGCFSACGGEIRGVGGLRGCGLALPLTAFRRLDRLARSTLKRSCQSRSGRIGAGGVRFRAAQGRDWRYA
jgi:hypothetical protein